MGAFHIILPILTLILVVLLTPLAARLARAAGAVDEPGGRRRHAAAVPKFGGLVIFASVAAALALPGFVVDGAANPLVSLLGPGWRWSSAGALVVLVLGLVDDVHRIGVPAKLAGQVVAALLAIEGGCIVTGITNPIHGSWIALGPFAIPVTVAWIVLVINAVNLIDGLDGLAAGSTTIICSTIAVLALIDGRPETALVAATLGAATAGFLFHNWHPATIFLGDSGSLFLGYALALLSMQGLQKGPTATLLLAPMLALGLPLFDTAAAVLRRASATGIASILTADRAHIHHRLVDRGMPQARAVMILYAACAAFGLAAIGVRQLHGTLQALLVAAVTVAVVIAATKLGYVGRSRDGN